MRDFSKMQSALIFADEAHQGQVRKYTGEDYINHCISVAVIVGNLPEATTEMICAAYLHDTVEDCGVKIWEIEKDFGIIIARYVEQLTDVYTKEAYPHLNRKERKRLEAERLGTISAPAKTIKLADIIDNTESIVYYDKNFAKVYLDEKADMLPFLKEGSAELMRMAVNQLSTPVTQH